MKRIAARGILLDVEGTTSSIRFVYEQMFPFVRRELRDYLQQNWSKEETAAACDLVARDAGFSNLDAWAEASEGQDAWQPVAHEVERQMDADQKTTGLKKLQGLIWRSGFESGELRSHLYEDVLPALRAWNSQGIDVRIYSSGSVEAQQLFFGHTSAGDLRSLFSGHYDTTIGSKQDAASYASIAEQFQLSAGDVLFVSDAIEELAAARTAGMQVLWCRRPENPNLDAVCDFASITDFRQIALETPGSTD